MTTTDGAVQTNGGIGVADVAKVRVQVDISKGATRRRERHSEDSGVNGGGDFDLVAQASVVNCSLDVLHGWDNECT